MRKSRTLKPTKEPVPAIQPRIVGEDSHEITVGPDGKVSFVARVEEPKKPTEIEVLEAANASDPRAHIRRHR